MEWKEAELETLLEALIDYRGKTPKKTSSGIPLITAKIIKAGTIAEPSEFIAEDNYDAWMVRGFPKAGDVVLTTEAPLGEVAQLDERKIALAQRVVCLRGKADVLDNTYLKYYFLSQVGHKALTARETGTTVTGIKQSELRKVNVVYPSIETQRRISSILSSLDRKIELNNKINATLEEMAQALFKSWFVDFEPFKNGNFIDTEIGKIPEGWRVGTLSEVGDIVCGKTPSKSNQEFYGGKIPFIKIPDMHNNVFVINSEDSLTEEGKASQPKKVIPPFSIMVSCIATVGLVALNVVETCTNQQINTIIPIHKRHRYFLYCNLKRRTEELKNLGRGGTATLNVNTRTFSNMPIVLPKDKCLADFTSLVEPLFAKLLANSQETLTLTHLRDTLLPRLMSGEIEV